jgi:hypothetical protein
MANMPNTRRAEAAQSMRPVQRTNSITRCFIAMRKSGLNFSAGRARRTPTGVAALAAMALLCCFTILINTTSRAQTCSPSAPPGCSWNTMTVTTSMDGSPLNGPDSVTCSGTPIGCCVAITFCYMCCNGNIMVDLQSVQPLNTNCTGITPDQFIDFGTWYAEVWSIYQYFGQGGTCDPKNQICPNGTTQVLSYVSNCWKLNNVVGDHVYTQCNSGCTCNISFDVCWNPMTHQLQYSNYMYSQTGSDCPPICAPEPSGGDPCTPSICYVINCPDGKGGHQ